MAAVDEGEWDLEHTEEHGDEDQVAEEKAASQAVTRRR